MGAFRFDGTKIFVLSLMALVIPRVSSEQQNMADPKGTSSNDSGNRFSGIGGRSVDIEAAERRFPPRNFDATAQSSTSDSNNFLWGDSGDLDWRDNLDSGPLAPQEPSGIVLAAPFPAPAAAVTRNSEIKLSTSSNGRPKTRWYFPGYGYFSRGGRAASNFIRFGRNAGDGAGLSSETPSLPLVVNSNHPNKKNNFIRLGRENPRTNNFIRLGRSEFWDSRAKIGGEAIGFYPDYFYTSSFSLTSPTVWTRPELTNRIPVTYDISDINPQG